MMELFVSQRHLPEEKEKKKAQMKKNVARATQIVSFWMQMLSLQHLSQNYPPVSE